MIAFKRATKIIIHDVLQYTIIDMLMLLVIKNKRKNSNDKTNP